MLPSVRKECQNLLPETSEPKNTTPTLTTTLVQKPFKADSRRLQFKPPHEGDNEVVQTPFTAPRSPDLAPSPQP